MSIIIIGKLVFFANIEPFGSDNEPMGLIKKSCAKNQNDFLHSFLSYTLMRFSQHYFIFKIFSYTCF